MGNGQLAAGFTSDRISGGVSFDVGFLVVWLVLAFFVDDLLGVLPVAAIWDSCAGRYKYNTLVDIINKTLPWLGILLTPHGRKRLNELTESDVI